MHTKVFDKFAACTFRASYSLDETYLLSDDGVHDVGEGETQDNLQKKGQSECVGTLRVCVAGERNVEQRIRE